MLEVLGGAILGLVRPPLLEPIGSQINETCIYITIFILMCIKIGSGSLQGRVGSGRSVRFGVAQGSVRVGIAQGSVRVGSLGSAHPFFFPCHGEVDGAVMF